MRLKMTKPYISASELVWPLLGEMRKTIKKYQDKQKLNAKLVWGLLYPMAYLGVFGAIPLTEEEMVYEKKVTNKIDEKLIVKLP